MKPLHILFAGAGLAVLGTFLPWASIEFKLLGVSQTASGINTGGGKIIFILAAGAAVLPLIRQPGKEKLMALISMISAALAALVAVANLFDGMNAAPSGSHPMIKEGGIEFSLGIGLYLCVLGCLGAAWGAFNIWKAAPAPQDAAPPPLPPQA